MAINAKTYLGQKGYTIYKDSISIKEHNSIRDDLNVRPFVPKSPIICEAFPVFRESHNKFYVPRFYGENIYGIANDNKLINYNNIDLTFNGELFDYQKNIISKYIDYVSNKNGGGLLEIPCGRGKTVMALKIIELMKLKTIIIVHKGFLLNQWIERIQQFLPNARIGKIQGPIFDIENKDIVIGMLQSLSMKTYEPTMFKSFGLTVVDECHHISAEVFVRSLFQIVTPYVLGLSATMQRKDGLTKVFKMFLGDVIYHEKRTSEDNVLVKAIDYEIDDEEFNEIKYDYRGNPIYSTMISKLCKFNNRSDFIIFVLKKILEENNNQQIMIIAHNKMLLTYLYKAIEYQNIATVGYYIGGMKEKDLKLSENKKIIIATYAMAAEALDIKTLTTLIMATPKTDVTQAVGRILRTKHIQPLIIDIIDQHAIFKNQWYKRVAFYKKNNYKIIHSNNSNFKDDIWDTIYDPANKPKKEKKKKEPTCLIQI